MEKIYLLHNSVL